MTYYTKQLINKYYKNPVPLVYAYRDMNDKIIYIGSTGNLYKRHNSHLYYGNIKYEYFDYLSIDYYLYKNPNTELFVIKECETREEAYKLESELIDIVKPVFNRTNRKFTTT